jgi:peptide/nickel transport system substrate-binding protein
VVTFYYDDPQAYRSDRFTGFQPQPDPNGVVLFQYGTYSYRNIAPPQAAAASSDGGGGVPVVPIAIGVAVLGGAGVLLALRRRSTQDERE